MSFIRRLFGLDSKLDPKITDLKSVMLSSFYDEINQKDDTFPILDDKNLTKYIQNSIRFIVKESKKYSEYSFLSIACYQIGVPTDQWYPFCQNIMAPLLKDLGIAIDIRSASFFLDREQVKRALKKIEKSFPIKDIVP